MDFTKPTTELIEDLTQLNEKTVRVEGVEFLVSVKAGRSSLELQLLPNSGEDLDTYKADPKPVDDKIINTLESKLGWVTRKNIRSDAAGANFLVVLSSLEKQIEKAL